MSLVRALISTALFPTAPALAAAFNGHARGARVGVYQDTRTRAMHRSLLDAAGLMDATVKVGFIKNDGELRYMLCRPVVEADGTCRYYTVLDLELTEKNNRDTYRRINLDSIAAIQVDYKAAA